MSYQYHTILLYILLGINYHTGTNVNTFSLCSPHTATLRKTRAVAHSLFFYEIRGNHGWSFFTNKVILWFEMLQH